MKKIFWMLGLLLLLSACGQREETVEGNLILTNYAAGAISGITVQYDGGTVFSEEAISDTQLCAFTLPEEECCIYTVSFETEEGETVCETFTDCFAEGSTVYLRADWTDGVWQLERDETAQE